MISLRTSTSPSGLVLSSRGMDALRTSISKHHNSASERRSIYQPLGDPSADEVVPPVRRAATADLVGALVPTRRSIESRVLLTACANWAFAWGLTPSFSSVSERFWSSFVRAL